jgi:hypothetical protein
LLLGAKIAPGLQGAEVEMPLSEDEERILQEIARGFYANDPNSARRIGRTTLPRYLARNCKWAAVGFLAGLAVLLVSFASSWYIGVFGFLVMLASGIVFTQNLRRMGQHGWRQLTRSTKARSLNESLSEAKERFRRRLGGD